MYWSACASQLGLVLRLCPMLILIVWGSFLVLLRCEMIKMIDLSLAFGLGAVFVLVLQVIL